MKPKRARPRIAAKAVDPSLSTERAGSGPTQRQQIESPRGRLSRQKASRETEAVREQESRRVQKPVPALGPPQQEEDIKATVMAATAQIGLRVPPILFEGDEPASSSPMGLGLKYALGPSPAPGRTTPEEPELPQAYGTGRLLLAARDPHCLYAHWDLTLEQQQRFNRLSVHRHLLVRVHPEALSRPPVSELHVHPESRHWFIHVDVPGARYVTELGYYEHGQQWRTIAVSEPAETPPGTFASEGAVQFATFPIEMPLGQARADLGTTFLQPQPVPQGPEQAPRKGAAAAIAPAGPPMPLFVHSPEEQPPSEKSVPSPVPVWRTVEMLRGAAQESFPTQAIASTSPGKWTAGQEEALAKLIGWALVHVSPPGSSELVGLLRPWLRQPFPAFEAAPEGAPGFEALFGGLFRLAAGGQISSPAGGNLPARRAFWFNINAELVIYGATEPDARVGIGGRSIRLRPDGTFSYRFALPDGRYELPITVASAEGEVRSADLAFLRATAYQGEVGSHPQDPALKKPEPDNVV